MTMDNLVLSSHIKAILAADRNIGSLGVEIKANQGVVTLAGTVEWMEDMDKIERAVLKVPGVKEIIPRMRVRLSWGDAEGLRIR